MTGGNSSITALGHAKSFGQLTVGFFACCAPDIKGGSQRQEELLGNAKVERAES